MSWTFLVVTAVAVGFIQFGALSVWVVVLKAILAVAALAASAAVALPLAHALVVSSHNDTGL